MSFSTRFPFLSTALASAALLAAGLSADARAGVVLSSGFKIETQPPHSWIAAVLPDSRVLVGNDFFSELSLRHPDGSQTLFATGFGSLAGVAQSPVTGDIIVGDSFGATALHVLRDLNNDGDALDAGENTAHPVALPLLPNGSAPLPFDLSFRPATDELYVSGSTPFSVFPVNGAIVRIAGGTATVFADGLGFAGGMVWDGGTLYAADLDANTFIGRVLALTDGNADDDATDLGEAVEFASGLSGASDLVRAQDGSFYVSGTHDPSFVGSVTHLLADADHSGQTDLVDENFALGFAFTGNLTLSEGAGGFQPGVAGDGSLVVQDFPGRPNDKTIRTAPLATLALNGPVQNNAAFDLVLGGAPGAGTILVLSLDQTDITLHGVGDLGLGFGAPNFLLSLETIGGGGSITLHVPLHNVSGAVGVQFTVQGFTLEGGEIGVSNPIDAVVAP